MAMPSALTVGSLALVVAAGAGLVAISASATEDGSASPPPAPAASDSTGSPHPASPGHNTSPGRNTSPSHSAPTTTAQTLTAPTKTTTASAPTRTTTPTAPAKTTTPTASQRTPHQSQQTPQTHPDAVPTVLVEVYNNSGITGLAAQRAAVLQGAGWNVAATDNWYGNIPANTVYYPPQLRDEAVRLAKVLGVQRLVPAVAPMQFDRLTVIFTSG